MAYGFGRLSVSATWSSSSSTTSGVSTEPDSNSSGESYVILDKTQGTHRRWRSEIDFPAGFQVHRGRFKVVRRLGQGGFGAVFEMLDSWSGKRCGMKAEWKIKDCVIGMKMEIRMLKKFQRSSKHAVRFIGCGELKLGSGDDGGVCCAKDITWVMMELVGENLYSLRNKCRGGYLTTGTVLQIGKQCIQALEDFHHLGYITRDVKPSNFAVGITPKTQKNIYMLDFGLARRIFDKDNRLRAPRRNPNVRGTMKYSSISIHRKIELGRHDDLISLMYSFVDLKSGHLPWEYAQSRNSAARTKWTIKTAVLFKECPREMQVMFRYLKSLTYYDEPDYSKLKELLQEAMNRKGYSDQTPYDWMEGGRTVHHTPILFEQLERWKKFSRELKKKECPKKLFAAKRNRILCVLTASW